MIGIRARLLVIGCLLFGAVLLAEILLPSSNGITDVAAPRRPPIPQVATPGKPPPIDDLLATVLARPLFSPTRRPEAGPGNAQATDLADKRLAGIVIDPERRLAIFAVNGGKPLTLTVGETVDGWRIEQISATEVSLSGVGGTRTLQPKTDPNLVRQPMAPQPAGTPLPLQQPPVAIAPGARFAPPVFANRPGRAGMPVGAPGGPQQPQPSTGPGRAGKQ